MLLKTKKPNLAEDTEKFTSLCFKCYGMPPATALGGNLLPAEGEEKQSLPRHCRHCNSIFQKNLPYSKLSTRLTSNIRFLLRQTRFLDFIMVQNGLLLLTPNCEK